nr:hypothetical protein [Alteraurantiacibacter buctensis]
MPRLRGAASRATTGSVKRPAGDQGFADAWDAVRSDGDIQFQPVPEPATPEPPTPPDWLTDLLEWLGTLLGPVAQAIAGNWFWLQWLLLGGLAVLVLWGLWRLIDPATLRFGRRARAEEEELRVDQGQALQLLEEADRLAAEGRFDEATHLLLQRSVGQIAELRPDLIPPSSTAREIAALPALPANARSAFATIAARVERSLFALTRLTRDDWQAARAAYADFALGYRGVRA